MTAASTPQIAAARAGVQLGDVVGELVEADGVGVDPRPVDEAVADQHVHHRQHQRDVGAGQRLDELVGGLGGERADRVDHDDLGAVGPGRLDRRPQVAVGEPGVRAPQDDQLAVAQLERVEARGRCRSSSRTPAPTVGPQIGPDEPAGAEVVEEALVEAHHRQQALVAGVAERQDRLGAVLVR